MEPGTDLQLKPSVERALAEGRPIVALESTVITHGLPRPTNLEAARAMEQAVRERGAEPATVAVLAGRIHVGLDEQQLEYLALESDAVKVSRRDLATCVALGRDGGTTVAGTMIVAHAAGVSVFATGGIGGVHRGDRGDVSADLPELARTPVAVVCAGAKSILDLPRTLEWLETAGVPVLGWRTDEFPAFFSPRSGLPISQRVDSTDTAANVIRTHWHLELNSGVLLTAPVPAESGIPQSELRSAMEAAERAARAAGVRGKELTPFLLTELAERTGGRTQDANLALLENNARIAADLAAALA